MSKKGEVGAGGGGMPASGEDQPDLRLETQQEILNLITWAAWLTKTVPCCKRTFDDLLERLVQTGPFFASLATEDQG